MNIFGMDIFVDTFGRIFFVILKATVSMALLITANDLKTTELSTYIMSLRHSISYCTLPPAYLSCEFAFHVRFQRIVRALSLNCQIELWPDLTGELWFLIT